MHHHDDTFPERGDSAAQVSNIGMRASGQRVIACSIRHGSSMDDREPEPHTQQKHRNPGNGRNYIDSAKGNLSAC
jgi:hypothetical protein